VEVGAGVEVPMADPMRLIKPTDVPLLSRDNKKKEESVLEFLVQVFYVLYFVGAGLGNQSKLDRLLLRARL
jgi:hypothetical protein